ncbi:MAG: tyrosine-type recombinase/integrase [Lachnospiraceae bacterium]|nr:tyrosine-type recombinase/integrase [Lachnospiraceae bacterium]
MVRMMTDELLGNYESYLREQEKSRATIRKYMCDLDKLVQFSGGRELTKVLVIEYKEYLRSEKNYRTSSINSFLVAANRFFEYMEWYDLKVKSFKVQKEAFMPENKELTKEEYKKLVEAAKENGKGRIGMIIQTICATGIRVSELSAITVSAVKKGIATIYNKGKERQILIPRNLQVKLLHFIRKHDIKKGSVFQTSKGKSVDRTWIWREMKKLCEKAGVEKDKVFPHNLRHLFARTFYTLYKDIAKLADILGHSSIETTRIYLKESYAEHLKQLEQMELLVGA